MNVYPVNVARVSNNLRSTMLLNTLRQTQLSLFDVQTQLATGQRIQTPSDDPLNAGYILQLQRHLDNINSVTSSLSSANAALTEGESAAQVAVDLVQQAKNLALQTSGDSSTPDERRSLVTVVDSLLDKLVSVGNRKYLNTPLFGGRGGVDKAFDEQAGGVFYTGDNGRLSTTADTDLSQDWFSLSGQEFFGAVSSAVQGFADLDPAIDISTRLSDLRGATNQGVRGGIIQVSDGTTTTNVDLTGADTVGDVLNTLNAQLPQTLRARIDKKSIIIERRIPLAGANITVSDTSGTTAADLGIKTATPQSRVQGLDLDPLLTLQTNLSQLNQGAGILPNGSFVIRDGQNAATVSLNGARTVEDVINRINATNIGVLASIDPDGRRIDVQNRLSGSDMTIEENGGTLATALGLRSFNTGVKLADLNDHKGVSTVPGPDFRITTADGSNIDFDMDSLNMSTATIANFIAALNTAGGGKITAGLDTTGNGIQITDNTTGGTPFSISKLNLSPAIDGLGLNVAASGNKIVGTDVNPIKVDNAFTGLIELRNALNNNDSAAIDAAGQRLDRALGNLQFQQGRLAAKAGTLQDRAQRIDLEQTATQSLTGNVRDVDMTEAIVRFQQLQTALQANLQSSTKIMSLSLMDYLR